MDQAQPSQVRLAGRALEDEFNQIAASLGGDVASRAAGDDYLLSTYALYHGGPASWAFTPKVFDEAGIALLRDAAETMGRIMERVTQAYLEDASIRALFHLPRALEELTLVPAGYRRMVPIGRVDVFLNEETGDFQFCELNTDGSAGMTVTAEVTQAIQRSATYAEFARRHPRIETFDVRRRCLWALLDTYAEWAQAHRGICDRHPSLAVVDYADSVSADEVDDLLEILRGWGVYAHFADIRELTVQRVGGVDRLVDSRGPITCVWRRAVTSEVAARPCSGTHALRHATQEGVVATVGGFRTWPCAAKTVFSALYEPECRRLLSSDEVAFVDAHVPETHVLTPESDLSRFADKDGWIAKPAGGYNSAGVVAGLDVTQRQWMDRLAVAARSGDVVQRYATQYRTPVLEGGELPEGANPLEARLASNMEGLYLFDGEFGGVFTRCGYGNTIGERVGRLNMGCLVVREGEA